MKPNIPQTILRTLLLAAAGITLASPLHAANNLTITSGSGDINLSGTPGPAITTADDDAFLETSTLVTGWGAGDLTVTSGTGGANSQAGGISIQGSINAATGHSLVLHAAAWLESGAGGVSLSTSGTGSITLEADGDDLVQGGGVLFGEGSSISTAGGALVINSFEGVDHVAPFSITTESNGKASNGYSGGNVAITSTNNRVRVGNISTGGVNNTSAHAGNVTISAKELSFMDPIGIAAGNISAASLSGTGGAVRLDAFGSVETGNIATWSGLDGGGKVTITSTTSSIVTGNINTGGWVDAISGSTGATAGDVDIKASWIVATGGISASSGGLGDGGSVSVASDAGSVTTTGNISTSSVNGRGGSVSLSSLNEISVGAIDTTGGTNIGDGGACAAGDVSISAPNAVSVASITSVGAANTGNIGLLAWAVSAGEITNGASHVTTTGQVVSIGHIQSDGLVEFHSFDLYAQNCADVQITGGIDGGCGVGFYLGNGSATLSGTSAYTGATDVHSGTLRVNGDNSAATGSITVYAGATLGGAGTVGGSTVVSGTLAPGAGVGTLTFTKDLDISLAEGLVFELGLPVSDKVKLLAGATLQIGMLGLDDFSFIDAGGFGPGDYLLFDTSTGITGSLDAANLTGVVLGYSAELMFADGGKDILLHVVPEPGTWAMILGGISLLAMRRPGRRRG